MVARLSLLVLRVADLNRARAFYEALGLAFQTERHGQGVEHLSSENDGVVIELYPKRAPSDSTASVRLGFAVHSVDQVLASLRGLEAEIVSNPSASPWGRRAVVRDSEGHTVELLEVDT